MRLRKKKAYDLMLHSWILECLKLYNINRTLRAFIKNAVGLWKTTLKVNSKPIGEVGIKCGIYLLFCIGLIPLSQIIRHLLYMDDIKLYARNECDTDSLIHLTRH